MISGKKPQSFSITAVPTSLFRSGLPEGPGRPVQDLADFVASHLIESTGPLREGAVVAVTSKLVSLAENRLISPATTSKTDLVKKEADIYLGEIAYHCHLTIKHGLLIAAAGIDESNSESGHYILYPENPFQSAQALQERLCLRFGIRKLGLLLTDSHTSPLRKGVTGITLAYAGMKAVKTLIGEPDLFGRPLQMTQINIADALSAAAVLAMGEANERRPVALIEGAEVEFLQPGQLVDEQEMRVSLEQDLYSPLFKSFMK